MFAVVHGKEYELYRGRLLYYCCYYYYYLSLNVLFTSLHDPKLSESQFPLCKMGMMIIMTIIIASEGHCDSLNEAVHVKHFALLQCLPTLSKPAIMLKPAVITFEVIGNYIQGQ